MKKKTEKARGVLGDRQEIVRNRSESVVKQTSRERERRTRQEGRRTKDEGWREGGRMEDGRMDGNGKTTLLLFICPYLAVWNDGGCGTTTWNHVLPVIPEQGTQQSGIHRAIHRQYGTVQFSKW